MLSKPRDEANLSFDLGIEKPRKSYRVLKENKAQKKNPTLSKPLSLSDMVTLQIIKSFHETGVVKKMIHAPTLKLFAVKVIKTNKILFK